MELQLPILKLLVIADKIFSDSLPEFFLFRITVTIGMIQECLYIGIRMLLQLLQPYPEIIL